MSTATQKKDEEVLAVLGYKQEFKRAFTPLEVFGIGFSIIGLLPSIASTLVFALPNGGPTALVWGWAICAFFIVFVGLALGELASSAPTSGGLYFWTFKYASPRWRNVLSWVVGYSNTMGNIAGLTSVVWGCAVQLMAAVSIGSGMTFTPTTGQIFGVFAGLLLLNAIVSSTATRFIARLQGIYVWLQALLCLAIIVAMPASTPKEFKNTARYAFGGFENLTSWTNGFAFVLSFLAPLWTIGGFDGPIHISEEAENAETAVPWAIVAAVGITGVLGWIINIVFAFFMGRDIEAIMASPIGQPMAAIFFNSFGTRPTLAIWSVVVAVQFMMGTSILISCSRQTFAFSRDGGLPGSTYLYRISPRTQTPINCVWASVCVALLLGALSFAGPSASSAIFSLAIIGQYTAFSIPIASRFLGGTPWRRGKFSLGRMGLPVSAVAVIWAVFSMVIVMFPSNPGPSASTMNYTVVVAGGWMVLCLVYYYFPVYGGVHWFQGPLSNVELSKSSRWSDSNVDQIVVDTQSEQSTTKRYLEKM